MLAENRAKLDSLAAALIEHETLDEDDAYAAAGVEHARPAVVGPLAVAAKVAKVFEPLGLSRRRAAASLNTGPSRHPRRTGLGLRSRTGSRRTPRRPAQDPGSPATSPTSVVVVQWPKCSQ